jgi:hypothetical protein
LTVALGVFSNVAYRVKSLSSNTLVLLLIAVGDAIMILFWISALGAVAHLRARFTVPVQVKGCYNDGSAVDSEQCFVKRADSPFLIAGPIALDLMSTVAGLCGLEM